MSTQTTGDTPAVAKRPARKSPARSPAATVKAVVPAPVKASAKAPVPLSNPEAATEKTTKSKKPKMVRDSFTIPKMEYAVLETMKERSAKLLSPAKKTELFRAGIKALAALPDAAFLAAIQAVPSLKTGRPAKPSAEQAAAKQ
jgi:hypothetical protein